MGYYMKFMENVKHFQFEEEFLTMNSNPDHLHNKHIF